MLAAWENDPAGRPAKWFVLNDRDPMLARPICGALKERTAADWPWLKPGPPRPKFAPPEPRPKLIPLPPPRTPPPRPRALASMSSIATAKRMIARMPMAGARTDARNADMTLVLDLNKSRRCGTP